MMTPITVLAIIIICFLLIEGNKIRAKAAEEAEFEEAGRRFQEYQHGLMKKAAEELKNSKQQMLISSLLLSKEEIIEKNKGLEKDLNNIFTEAVRCSMDQMTPDEYMMGPYYRVEQEIKTGQDILSRY
jgi:hypothetical protein